MSSTFSQQPQQPPQSWLWPNHNNPFHRGEVYVQQRYKVHDRVMSYAAKVIRPFMPDQHRDFYTDQPFLVVAARDANNHMWSSLIVAQPPSSTNTSTGRVATSPNPTTLQFHGDVVNGDALEGQLHVNADIGLLGIQLHTKRRNRVNGRIVAASESDYKYTFMVDQSFGNCPQYITPREWWWWEGDSNEAKPEATRTLNGLSAEQIERIRATDTIFLASGYRRNDENNNAIEDVRYGNDASHRGGSPGFVHVPNSNTILIPDYSGNNHYNTMGNLLLDSSMGITIPSFTNGAMLQLSGKGKVLFDEEADAAYAGMERVIQFTIERIHDLPPNSLPLRWSSNNSNDNDNIQLVQVSQIVPETDNVKSFYFTPAPHPQTGKKSKLWTYQSGQYLPIQFDTGKLHGVLSRTYSLSQSSLSTVLGGNQGGCQGGCYRISVKRHDMGKASRYLHDHVKVGDILKVEPPSGDLVLPKQAKEKESNGKTIVLVSVGIGITPILAMLDELVQHHACDNPSDDDNDKKTCRPPKNVVWIHGARNGKEHAFRQEVNEHLERASKSKALNVTSCVVYSQPTSNDVLEQDYQVHGRINTALVQELLPNNDAKNAEYYMCGVPEFVAHMEEGLVAAGADNKDIHYESF